MKFLVNPGKTRANKGGQMAKRKTPPRYKSGPKKGQFMPKSARRKRANPVRKTRKRRSSTRRASSATTTTRRRRRRTARRNPPRRDIVGMVVDGAMGAGGVLVGKASARAIPALVGLPQAGNVGLAIQAATAVAVGWLADSFVGRDVGQYVLAGGISAPLESLVVRLNIPFLSSALAQAPGTVGAYVMPRRALRNPAPRALPRPGRVASYVQPASGWDAGSFARA